MTYSPFPGPTSAYQNVPINPQNYLPRSFFISGITLGTNTTVQTTKNMNYSIGQLVRLLVPQSSGSYQLNQQLGYVISIPQQNQVVIQIDSSQNVNPFISSTSSTQPQIVAVGDINSGIISSTGANIQFQSIPGAFINIS